MRRKKITSRVYDMVYAFALVADNCKYHNATFQNYSTVWRFNALLASYN